MRSLRCVLIEGAALALAVFVFVSGALAEDKAANDKGKKGDEAAATEKSDAESAEKSDATPAEEATPKEGEETEGEAEAAAEESADTESLFSASASTSSEPVPADEEKPAAAEEKTEAPAKAAEEPKILQGTWTKSVVFATDDGMFKLQPRGFVQPWFRLPLNPDADDVYAGMGFAIKRGRAGFTAWLFKLGQVYLDADFADGTAKLVDYYVDIDPLQGQLVVRVGKFRPYLGRQFLMGTTKLMMIENALAWSDKKLGMALSRDFGLGIHGLAFGGFEYGVGVWNGEGQDLANVDGRSADPATGKLSSPANATDAIQIPGNIDYQVGGRLAVHPLKLAGIGEALPLGDESDAARSDKPGLAIGAGAMYNRRHERLILMPLGDPDSIADDEYALYYDQQVKAGADVAFKYIGLSIQTEVFMIYTMLLDDVPGPIETQIKAADKLGKSNIEGLGLGTYLQAGYFVLPEHLEVALRVDLVEEDIDLRGMRLFPAVGLNYYIFGNNLKAQLMYRMNVGIDYGKTDPGYIPMTHDIFLMLQASI